MPSSSFVFGGFPLSSQFVVKFPTPFQAFPSSPFEFISGSLFVWFVLSPRFVFCFSLFPLRLFSPQPPCFVLSPLFLPPFFLPSRAGVQSPFIGGKGSGASLWLHGERGSAGRLASRCDWQGATPSTFHHETVWGAALAGMWRVGFNEERRKIAFPCYTSRGRRKGNSVVQNDTVLHFFFLT